MNLALIQISTENVLLRTVLPILHLIAPELLMVKTPVEIIVINVVLMLARGALQNLILAL